MRAEEIGNMLASKHWQDIFVPECKDGSSQGGHLRLDAWVMKKSWAHPMTIGYEIKVSRSDFVGDEKWRGYLPYCNEFYFVCPHSLIQPHELPDDTGLLWVSKTGSRLYKKKKPVYNTKTKLEEIYKYVIMCRSRITTNTYYAENPSAREVWKEWLAQKDEDKRLGWNVGKKIQELVRTRIDEVENKTRWVESENKKLAYIRDELKKLGFDGVPEKWTFDRKLEQAQKAVPQEFEANLIALKNNIEKTLEALTSTPRRQE